MTGRDKRLTYGSLGLLAGAAGAAAYVLRVRPKLIHWGATEHELEREWTSDDLSPDECKFEATRAVTVHAPAEDVWRWVVQVGQDRAGFYSYDWLENLFGLDMHNIEEIVPEFQDREEGDIVWLASPERFGGGSHLIVGLLEPERVMALVRPADAEALALGEQADHGYWAFHVEPVDDESCRLILRTRGGKDPGLGEKLAGRLFWDFAHFVMERKMLKTIKGLAEEEVVSAG